MPFFTVTMEHPAGPGWDEHVKAHVEYLEQMVDAGTLRASGPVKDGPLRAGFLIFEATDRAAVQKLVDEDPFAVAGLIERLEIHEWDPVFGVFSAGSSGRIPGA